MNNKEHPDTELTYAERLDHHSVDRAEIVMWVAISAEGFDMTPRAVAMTEEALRAALLVIHEKRHEDVPADWWPDDTIIDRVPARFAIDNHDDPVDMTTRAVDWGHAAWDELDGMWINRKLDGPRAGGGR